MLLSFSSSIQIILASFLLLLSLADALSIHPLKTLVVYDNRLTDLQDYSKFFQNLQDRSYDFTFASINNDTDKIRLYSDEEKLYDNLIIFPIKTKRMSSEITPKKLLKYFEDGGDILTITSPNGLTDPVRLFLNELGIFPSPKQYHLIDVFQNEGSADPSSSVTIPVSETLNKFVYDSHDDTTETELIYQGSSALLNNNKFLVPVLQAPKTSINKRIDAKTNVVDANSEEWTIGSQGYVVVGFQNLKNSRCSWIGSDKFFSNEYFESNSKFVTELVKWTFKEKGVIKSLGFNHSHFDGRSYEEEPYKIKDDIVYDLYLSEWDGDKWVPYKSDDVQFELKMIDPYYRLTLEASDKVIDNISTVYTTGRFKLPDHHGVFTFLTDYKRPGLTFIEELDIKAIRHLAHTEYLRSYEITNAWVYLTSIYSVISLWIVFVALIIISARKTTSKPVSQTKKTQ
ncbi:related to Dolichyl-diphosphooligosaccharide--protein glycosyltransferase subunit WBP1 [Saccharomycodes ludwigii]|uniref:Dolichyl-diphosphooligosaccharide--protein glycosyltransferase subunit WBP1 n=1 Tax=Saccharomycodes ludwigii TaxID=36035 RepID=A0A376BBQ7_9ASCO|nr:hypothetical protein SCDLUD_005159 [Saccharomycodes ludwigii]KAH3898821.1 hypothetical protein SCDLUD_005159 [Saccharomycodes ludwigii]SSD62125.1 related to Dolichyl-diphosphooligosaccharide--protein glycosyltransferase subunit WBP1 [Saccharomycodes ludwigii]